MSRNTLLKQESAGCIMLIGGSIALVISCGDLCMVENKNCERRVFVAA